MTSQRDIERLLDHWFSDGPTGVPDRVVDIVADRIERQSQRPAWRLLPRRNIHVNIMLRLAAATAAIVLVTILGFSVMQPNRSAVGGPSPTPTAVPPTASPATPAYAWPATLAAGTYTTSFIWDFPFNVTLTVPDGWQSRDIEVIKDPLRQNEVGGSGGVAVSFTLAENVYADPCGHVLLEPSVGPSVDDLATALSTVPGIDATTPTAVSFDRSTAGKYLEFAVRNDIGCALGNVYLWDLPAASVRRDRGPVGGLTWGAEQQHNRVWILDVDGVRLVIDATWSPAATPAGLAELQGVIDSIRIVRPGATPPPQPFVQ
jgi:hypothetical protein